MGSITHIDGSFAIHHSTTHSFPRSPLRALGKFCRTRKQSRQLRWRCPQFIEIRWSDDHRILEFVIAHEQEMKGFEIEGYRVTSPFHARSELLKDWWMLVTELEGSACPFARSLTLIN
jgi:hypothetical protein